MASAHPASEASQDTLVDPDGADPGPWWDSVRVGDRDAEAPGRGCRRRQKLQEAFCCNDPPGPPAEQRPKTPLESFTLAQKCQFLRRPPPGLKPPSGSVLL